MELSITEADNRLIEAYWDKLCTLSRTVKLSLASRLTYAVLEEETAATPQPSKRTARVKKRTTYYHTDEELEARFASEPVPEIPTEEGSWHEIIKANSGKTIKPVEKWL